MPQAESILSRSLGVEYTPAQGRKVFPRAISAWRSRVVVVGGEAGFLLGGEREPGVVHVQSPEKASGQERFKSIPAFRAMA